MPTKKQFAEQAYTDARKRLTVWGVATILIYLAFVLVYPLFPYIYREGKMLDLELILRNGPRILILVYLLGLMFLFYAFWSMVRILHRLSKEFPSEAARLRNLTLAIGVASGFILLWLYPVTALDVAVYVINARNWVLYGGNPLTVPPETFASDPYIHLAGEYVNKTSPYGPVWEGIARLPVQFGITDIGAGIVAMKVITFLCMVGMAVLIGWYARQQDEKYSVSQATALGFFILNPLVLLEAVGNAHNDMMMAAFVMLGLIFWQRGKWAWATLALTLASLVKLPALILLPLFGLTVLMEAPTWKERLLRGLGIGLIFLGVFLGLYRLMGPFPEVFTGIIQSFGRRSFSPAYALYVIVREFAPTVAPYFLSQSRNVFLVVYLFIIVQLLRKKLTLLEAGFISYFSLIYLTNAFRIWYPLWFLPFAVLNLNSRTFWRTFLFSLTAEFSILSYYILWRWYWRYWDWGLNGPLAAYWDYFKIMTPFTVSWVFSLPFLGDVVGRIRDKKRFVEQLWV
ncbi:MAG TPA: hypothetical protein PK414_11695 [Anaerolineales bacterium]|nr:hypothetical protein [Anaerolineales bacterium]